VALGMLTGQAWRRRVPGLLLLAVSWISCSLTSPADAGAAPARVADYYSRLVTQPGQLSGEVKKEGVLPVERYDGNLFNHTAFREWLMRKASCAGSCCHPGAARLQLPAKAPLVLRQLPPPRRTIVRSESGSSCSPSLAPCCTPQ
jgi:hypothetical protein